MTTIESQDPKTVHRVETWMKTVLQSRPEYEYSAFDLAVDCTHDLRLWDNNGPGAEYDIPQWIIELAERMLPE